MTRKDLRPGLIVIHRKYDRKYKVTSCNMRFKDSKFGWVDGVLYTPLYENKFDSFARDIKSFLEDFDVFV